MSLSPFLPPLSLSFSICLSFSLIRDGLDFPVWLHIRKLLLVYAYTCSDATKSCPQISILADRFSWHREERAPARRRSSFRAFQAASRDVRYARQGRRQKKREREREERWERVSKQESESFAGRAALASRSRLEITPFHPYLRGERVSRKGAVASGIA